MWCIDVIVIVVLNDLISFDFNLFNLSLEKIIKISEEYVIIIHRP